MGRRSYSTREEADLVKKVEIWWLKKYGYLDGWKSGGMEWKHGWNGGSIGIIGSTIDNDKYIRFQYNQTNWDGEKKTFDYKVELTTTPCNYGGVRYWFICPLSKNKVYCGRRIGVLYKNGDYFGCRHCHDLTYCSQKMNRNNKFSSLFNVVYVEKKILELKEKIKRPYYAGRPTKKQRKLERLCGQASNDYNNFTRSKGKTML